MDNRNVLVIKNSSICHLFVTRHIHNLIQLVTAKIDTSQLTNYFMRFMNVMKKALAIAVTAIVTGTLSCATLADKNEKSDKTGHFKFQSIESSANAADWDVTAPWKLPRGYTQTVVSDESDLNIYDGGRDDWHDMNVVIEK